jgi:hypothetical protein
MATFPGGNLALVGEVFVPQSGGQGEDRQDMRCCPMADLHETLVMVQVGDERGPSMSPWLSFLGS